MRLLHRQRGTRRPVQLTLQSPDCSLAQPHPLQPRGHHATHFKKPCAQFTPLFPSCSAPFYGYLKLIYKYLFKQKLLLKKYTASGQKHYLHLTCTSRNKNIPLLRNVLAQLKCAPRSGFRDLIPCSGRQHFHKIPSSHLCFGQIVISIPSSLKSPARARMRYFPDAKHVCATF